MKRTKGVAVLDVLIGVTLISTVFFSSIAFYTKVGFNSPAIVQSDEVKYDMKNISLARKGELINIPMEYIHVSGNLISYKGKQLTVILQK